MSTTADLTIDVIIPVHTPSRPVSRAVRSVLRSQHRGVRAVVVCHNTPMDGIVTQLSGFTDSRIKVLELHDGIHSPAGPLNAGLEVSDARYVTFLGSDDELDPGVLDVWASELIGTPDVLIGQLISDATGRVLAPAPRVLRFANLHPVRDLLNRRTAPVGAVFMRSLLVADGSPRFQAGFRSGEDIALGVYIWNTARRINYSRSSHGYRVHDDAEDRVSLIPAPLADTFRPVLQLLEQPWLVRLSERARRSLATKIVRFQILNHARRVAHVSQLTADDQAALQATLRAWLSFAPRLTRALSQAEARMIRAILAREPRPFQAGQGPRPLRLLEQVMTNHPFAVLSPDGVVRPALRARIIPLTLRQKARS